MTAMKKIQFAGWLLIAMGVLRILTGDSATPFIVGALVVAALHYAAQAVIEALKDRASNVTINTTSIPVDPDIEKMKEIFAGIANFRGM